MALVLALGTVRGGQAAEGGETGAARTDLATRAAKLADLKRYFTLKEADLTRLSQEHRARLQEADTLSRQVKSQKEHKDAGYFEQRALEKNLASLRTLYEEMERAGAREQEVREEAFAAAAAIVTELDSFLEADLVTLRDLPDPVARQRVVDRVLGLERDRRSYQSRMNDLTPEMPDPRSLPRDVAWTKEMVEDQRRAWEAAVARLAAEREQMAGELKLRHDLAEALGADHRDDPSESRLRARLADLDRRLTATRATYDRLAAREAEARSGAAPSATVGHATEGR